VYTVEHNVKVFFVGKVAKNYEQQVVTDYNNAHRPLPDRPYDTFETTEDDYLYTEGANPDYVPAERHGSYSPKANDEVAEDQYQGNDDRCKDQDPSHEHEDLYNP
jgi:hypothetical protein